MEEKYTCETCGKEYNALNKIAHQIFCKNKERYRSYSNIKNKEPIDNTEGNEERKKENFSRKRPKSKAKYYSNIHTLFSNNDNDEQKEEPENNDINLIKLKPKIILKAKNSNNPHNIFQKDNNNVFFNNSKKIEQINLKKPHENKRFVIKNNNINIQLNAQKKNSVNNINLQSKNNNNKFCISKNNNIMINKDNMLLFSGNNDINLIINSKDNIDKNKEEQIKKDEEFAKQLMQEELKIEEKERIERQKKAEEDSKKNELEIKRLLEEDIKQIENNKYEEELIKKKQELNNIFEERKRQMEELKRKTEEEFKKKEEERKKLMEDLEKQRKRQEEQRKKLIEVLEEQRRRLEEQVRKTEEENKRRNEERIRREDETWLRNNYNNLIETKIKADKLNEENKKCVICLEDFKDNDNVIFLPCFHVFHPKCITSWLRKKDDCPLCKINIKNNLNNNL